MAMKLSALIEDFLGAFVPYPDRAPLPYAKWDKTRLDQYLGWDIHPLPYNIQFFIDGQDTFTELEHDAIEAAIERVFEIPAGYAAAFCAFSPKPRTVAFIKWSAKDEAEARKSRL
jgi:hypothetical protein